MKEIYYDVCEKNSAYLTKKYSTSFSLGILLLGKEIRQPIYNVYGLVRVADEIVDTFESCDQEMMLNDFVSDTAKAVKCKVSFNPVLQSFQDTYHKYNLDYDLVEKFFESMRMDLSKKEYDHEKYKEYILGSAEVVGLMCLKVFCNGETEAYEQLKPYAMRLGAAFQKINFLRDVKADFESLGRVYFPEVKDMQHFTRQEKLDIEQEILADFQEAFIGIKKLPRTSRNGVHLAFYYYLNLFYKIRKVPAARLLHERIRIPNGQKLWLMMKSNFHLRFNTLRIK